MMKLSLGNIATRRKDDNGDLELFPKSEKRKKPAKCLTILAVSLGLCLVELSQCMGMQISSDGQVPQTCLSDACNNTAIRIQNAMDLNVDPCDDFYEFACGNWTKNNPNPGWFYKWVPFWKLKFKTFDEVRELLEDGTPAPEGFLTPVVKAKEFYKSCMDTDKLKKIGVDPIIQTLSSLGLPPQVPRVWSGLPWNEQAARIYLMLDESALLDVQVIDLRIDTIMRKYLVVSPPDSSGKSLGPGIKDINDSANKFISYMVKVFDAEVDEQQFIADIVAFHENLTQISTKNLCSSNDSSVMLDVSKDDASEGQLPGDQSEILYPSKAACNSTLEAILTLSNISVYDQQLPESWRKMNWTGYLDLILENTTVKLNLDDIILVRDPYYLMNLMGLLARTDPLIVEKYLFWSVFLEVAPRTLPEFGDLQLEVTKVSNGQEQRKPRWQKCTEMVIEYFDHALSYLYDQTHPKDSKNKAIDILKDIREAFVLEVNRLDWIDEETRLKILKKIRDMRSYVGFQDEASTPEKLDEIYNAVVEGDFFKTYLNLQQATAKDNLGSLRKKSDRKREILNIATGFGPFYAGEEMNTLRIPGQILQPPFCGTGFEAIDYGTIGSIIGHEVTHGFDSKGHLVDEHGEPSNWIEGTEEQYQQKMQCFIDQYNQYNVSGVSNITVNGLKTLKENIADNGGLHAAFNAFTLYTQRNPDTNNARLPGIPQYDPQQLFFLGFAQTYCGSATPEYLEKELLIGDHSPSKIRVIGSLSNSQEFADTWKCPAGSPMNPKHKCVLW